MGEPHMACDVSQDSEVWIQTRVVKDLYYCGGFMNNRENDHGKIVTPVYCMSGFGAEDDNFYICIKLKDIYV